MIRTRRDFLLLSVATAAGTSMARGEGLPEGLVPRHPRLFAGASDWEKLRTSIKAGKLPPGFIEGCHDAARKVLDLPTCERVVEGRRMLAVSREVLSRVMLLAFAERTGGPGGSGARAISEMRAAAAFSDWNPSHFLDTAEMTCALAIGYDWLHDTIDTATRKAIEDAIIQKGLDPAVKLVKKRTGFPWWTNNWNQVCWGGILTGALAVAEKAPEQCRILLDCARETIGNGLKALSPDGVYPEGPGYWAYGTIYQVLMIEVLRSALGTDWGLPRHPGFLASADFFMHAAGPTGYMFNFADGSPGKAGSAAMVWMARERGMSSYLAHENSRLSNLDKSKKPAALDPLVAFWWTKAAEGKSTPLPTHWHGRGHNPVAMWRSAWNNPDALYFAIKAGGANLSHGHMDAGQFVLEAGGVRWAHDLGMQRYHELESKKLVLWDYAQDSDRWKVFRLNSHAHNTLTVDGKLHVAEALCPMESADGQGCQIDLGPALGLPGLTARRQVRWFGDSVEMTDHLVGLAKGAIPRWAMNTTAEASIHGNTVLLKENRRTLRITFSLPPGTTLSVADISGPINEWDAPNPGMRQIHASGPAGPSGEWEVTAKFALAG